MMTTLSKTLSFYKFYTTVQMSKKINSTWYSYDKFVFEDHQLVNKRLPNNYLWSKSKYKTQITKNDLPKSFVYGRYYKRWGYIDTANVKDILYVPHNYTDHFLKDDCLLISYTGKILRTEIATSGRSYEEYLNESYKIYGSEIIDILKGVREYSGINIDEQIGQIKGKVKWLESKYPDKYLSMFNKIDVDHLFSEPIYNRDYHYKGD